MPEEMELSEREREILRLVATGASNKEIATRLVISPNTVKVHLRNIFAKVGVASRTEATLYALRVGLLASPATSTLTAVEPAVPVVAMQTVDAPAAASPAAPAAVVQLPVAKSALRRAAELLLLAALLALSSLVTWAALRTPLNDPAAQATPAAVNPASADVTTRWSELPPLPEPLTGAAGAVYENALYVLAGENGGQPSAQTWRFDLLNTQWEPAAAKPTPVSRSAAALLGEKIYVAGGRTASGRPSPALEVYDPRTDNWETRAALPTALEGHALVALDGRLYLFGGWDGSKERAEVYRYTPELDRWEPRTAMPAARAYAAAAPIDSKILVAGGVSGGTTLASTDLYFPNRDSSGSDPWESAAALPQPRAHITAAGLAGIVYITGGEGAPDGQPLEYVQQSNTWEGFEPPPNPPGQMPLLLAFHTHLYLLDGGHHQAYQAIYNLSFPVIR